MVPCPTQPTSSLVGAKAWLEWAVDGGCAWCRRRASTWVWDEEVRALNHVLWRAQPLIRDEQFYYEHTLWMLLTDDTDAILSNNVSVGWRDTAGSVRATALQI